MSLTKAALIEALQPRVKSVKIPGIGKVLIRSCPQLISATRLVSYTDPATGRMVPEEQAKAPIHEIIDQVMIDENTPMFTDDDIPQLMSTASERFALLSDAVREFNEEEGQKKAPSE